MRWKGKAVELSVGSGSGFMVKGDYDCGVKGEQKLPRDASVSLIFDHVIRYLDEGSSGCVGRKNRRALCRIEHNNI